MDILDLFEHVVSMGEPNACTAKQPNDYLTSLPGLHDQPVVLRVRAWRRKGKGVIGGQQIRTSDVIQIYYVLVTWSTSALL